MIEVATSREFLAWLRTLDGAARARIRARVLRLASGNPGSHRVLAGGVFELKVDHASGYRVYYVRTGKAKVKVLRGGDKRTQRYDIQAARRAAKQERS